MAKCQRCKVLITGGDYCQTCGPILATRKEWKRRFVGATSMAIFVVACLLNFKDYLNGFWQDFGWHQVLGNVIILPMLLLMFIFPRYFLVEEDEEDDVSEEDFTWMRVIIFGMMLSPFLLDGWWCVLAIACPVVKPSSRIPKNTGVKRVIVLAPLVFTPSTAAFKITGLEVPSLTPRAFAWARAALVRTPIKRASSWAKQERTKVINGFCWIPVSVSQN